MHFCSQCENMYYIRLDEDNANKLIYYCRHCGNEDSNIVTDNVSVSKILVKNNEQNFSNIINKYTKLDPTLPRVNNILCPNPLCETNLLEEKKNDKEQSPLAEREIIYIRYDDTNMKYIYLCSTCDTAWKMDNTNV